MTTLLIGITVIAMVCITQVYINKLDGPFVILIDIWMLFSWKMLAQVLPGIVAAYYLIEALESHSLLMRLSWIRLMFGRPYNNTTFVPAEILHPMSNPVFQHIFPLIACVSLLLFLPLLSFIQEYIFRYKRTKTWQVVGSALLFGCQYAAIGASFGMAIGMSVVGLFYAFQYRRAFSRSPLNLELDRHNQALEYSTSYHTMWNSLAVLYVFIRYNF